MASADVALVGPSSLASLAPLATAKKHAAAAAAAPARPAIGAAAFKGLRPCISHRARVHAVRAPVWCSTPSSTGTLYRIVSTPTVAWPHTTAASNPVRGRAAAGSCVASREALASKPVPAATVAYLIPVSRARTLGTKIFVSDFVRLFTSNDGSKSSHRAHLPL
jgi:hypothetical protein